MERKVGRWGSASTRNCRVKKKVRRKVLMLEVGKSKSREGKRCWKGEIVVTNFAKGINDLKSFSTVAPLAGLASRRVKV